MEHSPVTAAVSIASAGCWTSSGAIRCRSVSYQQLTKDFRHIAPVPSEVIFPAMQKSTLTEIKMAVRRPTAHQQEELLALLKKELGSAPRLENEEGIEGSPAPSLRRAAAGFVH